MLNDTFFNSHNIKAVSVHYGIWVIHQSILQSHIQHMIPVRKWRKWRSNGNRYNKLKRKFKQQCEKKEGRREREETKEIKKVKTEISGSILTRKRKVSHHYKNPSRWRNDINIFVKNRRQRWNRNWGKRNTGEEDEEELTDEKIKQQIQNLKTRKQGMKSTNWQQLIETQMEVYERRED